MIRCLDDKFIRDLLVIMVSRCFFLFFLIFNFIGTKSRFMYIIRSDAGQPLREELAKSPEKILERVFPEFVPKSDASIAQGDLTAQAALMSEDGVVTPVPESSNPPSATPGATSDAYFQGLALIKTLVKLMPGWLHSNRMVFDILVLLWKSPARMARLQNEQELNLMQVSLMATEVEVRYSCGTLFSD